MQATMIRHKSDKTMQLPHILHYNRSEMHVASWKTGQIFL